MNREILPGNVFVFFFYFTKRNLEKLRGRMNTKINIDHNRKLYISNVTIFVQLQGEINNFTVIRRRPLQQQYETSQVNYSDEGRCTMIEGEGGLIFHCELCFSFGHLS